MKILFIVPYPTSGPSNRFRVEQYTDYLNANGAKCLIRPFYSEYFYRLLRKRGSYIQKFVYLAAFSIRRLADLVLSIGCDITFIHREAFPAKGYIFEWLFRIFSKKLVYDFDDSVFLKKPAKVRATLRMADSVIAGNEFLKNYALSLNEEVCILPTCIDSDRYRPVGDRDSRKVVIGWMGTPTTSEYLKGIKGLFDSILDKYGNVEIKIIGGMSDDFLGPRVTYKRWSLQEEVRDLQGFDIGIMPMPDNDWTKGKCAFKIIQYMAVGIPSVASPVGMNKDVINDASNGFLVNTDGEWLDKLSKLIDSPVLRAEMGRRGRETVEEKYSLKVNAPKFLEILEKVFAGKAAI